MTEFALPILVELASNFTEYVFLAGGSQAKLRQVCVILTEQSMKLGMNFTKYRTLSIVAFGIT